MAGPVLQQAVQVVPVAAVEHVEPHVVHTGEHPLDRGVVEQARGDVRGERVGDQCAIAVVVEVGAGDPDDPGVGRQVPLPVAQVQRGEQLAQRQVAGAAEDREVTDVGRRGDRLGGTHAANLERSSVFYKHNFKLSQT